MMKVYTVNRKISELQIKR